jgi:UbiD family decarboxylase
MITNLSQYVTILKNEREIVEVTAPVDPYLEIAEIHRSVIAAGGPALLFRNVVGSPFPLVTNLFGTARRVDLAFGPRPEAFIREVALLPQELLPPTPSKLWAKRSFLGSMLKVGLSHRLSGPITEVIERSPKLTQLPLLTTWPKDGGAFITLPLVYTEHPETKLHNLGMYRIQRYDDEHTGLHMQIGKGGGFHLAAAEDLNQPLPVTIYVGGPPALILAAIAPLPENVPELLLASLVQGQKLRLVNSRLAPHPLISEAEFALVGEVAPHARHPEGPFGDHYGYYSLQHDYPLFRCRTVFRKKQPLCAATVVGKPRQEDFFLGDYLQKLLKPLIKLVMPTVMDLWSYGETGYHSLAAAVVRQRYKREAMVSAFRILGEGQLSLTKFLLVLDKPLDLTDFRAVLEYVLARADLRTDLYLFGNLSMDTLDYTGPTVNAGSKGVLLGMGDPIRTLLGEFNGELPRGTRAALPFCRGCLVISGPTYTDGPNFASILSQNDSLKNWPLVILVDDAQRTVRTDMNFLWTTFTRFEPARDMHAARTEVIYNHVAQHAPLIIDARMKPTYPEELFSNEATKDLVKRRWQEYFPLGVEYGNSDTAHLS